MYWRHLGALLWPPGGYEKWQGIHVYRRWIGFNEHHALPRHMPRNRCLPTVYYGFTAPYSTHDMWQGIDAYLGWIRANEHHALPGHMPTNRCLPTVYYDFTAPYSTHDMWKGIDVYLRWIRFNGHHSTQGNVTTNRCLPTVYCNHRTSEITMRCVKETTLKIFRCLHEKHVTKSHKT